MSHTQAMKILFEMADSGKVDSSIAKDIDAVLKP
jgi:hypothetical protein